MFWGILGGGTVAALTTGKTAPDFSLAAMNGSKTNGSKTNGSKMTGGKMDGGKFSLREALARGPVLAAFFKISCPVCQYAFPFLERIYRSHGSPHVTMVGISQNDAKETAAFAKEYGVTFPVLLEDTDTFAVSNAYGLTNVPTIFWIAQDGEIEISSVGWSRQDIDEINRKAAAANGDTLMPVFEANESVPEFRAG
jgi:peroxiredoxin